MFGFPEDAVRAALKQTGGNKEAAANRLLGGQEHFQSQRIFMIRVHTPSRTARCLRAGCQLE